MGNCYAVHFLLTNPNSYSTRNEQNVRKESCSSSPELVRKTPYNQNNREVIRVVKTDGKVLEYSKPVLVRDVLMNFSGFRIVLLSKTSTNYILPENHRLMAGNVYHLVPTLNFSLKRSYNPAVPKVSPVSINGGCDRIKVTMTKKQLQELLLVNNISIKEMSSSVGVNKKVFYKKFSYRRPSTHRSWQPLLETICEENE